MFIADFFGCSRVFLFVAQYFVDCVFFALVASAFGDLCGSLITSRGGLFE